MSAVAYPEDPRSVLATDFPDWVIYPGPQATVFMAMRRAPLTDQQVHAGLFALVPFSEPSALRDTLMKQRQIESRLGGQVSL